VTRRTERVEAVAPPATPKTPSPGTPTDPISPATPAGPDVPRTRHFEDVTELVVRTIETLDGEDVIGWAHDRVDPDTMGANGLFWYLLREKFGKTYTCFYSKRMSFLMNRSLATNFLPAGVLRRCEQTDNLAEVALKAQLIVILDATCPEIMTDFAHLIRRSKEVKSKPILFIDHHRRGSSDIEDLPNAIGVRSEEAQSTSAILVHVVQNLGLDLRGSDEGFRLAVVARAGIETDLIGVDEKAYAPSTREALAYLDEVLGERGLEVLDRLRAIRHPTSWYRKLGEALAQVENYDTTIAVVGLGVIDDTGIVPFVANRLMEMIGFKTTIVFGLVYDRIEGQIISVDLDASGRSTQDTEIVLADLFHDIFFVTDQAGRKTSRGGGRSNMLLGDYSGAGASVPLDYWRQLHARSAEEKVQVLHRLAWPAEFLRMRHLLTQRIQTLKPEEVRSVVPVPAIEGL
jgi:nanoRNase/pAp phosphatase (c-di-AMP/oligoRNAs hydrolase)